MENKYSGMTVNERLYISGLMNRFDRAIHEKNIEEVRLILKKVDIIDETAIEAILQQIGLK